MAKKAVESLRSAHYAELIEVLIEAREASGLRHDELAKILGKGRTYIYSIEHYGRRVDPAEVVEIGAALNLAPLELFSRWIERMTVDKAS